MTTKRFKQILILSLVVLVVFYICLGIGVAKIKKHRSETQTTLPTLMTSDVQPRTTAPQEAPAVTIGGNQVTSGSQAIPQVSTTAPLVTQTPGADPAVSTPSASQPAAASVPTGKAQIVAAYVNAVNKLKATGDFTLVKTDVLNVVIDEMSPASVRSMADKMIANSKDASPKTYRFTGGSDPTNGASVNHIVAPVDRGAALSESAVTSATATPTADGGYQLHLTLGREQQTKNSSAPNYAGVMEVINTDTMGLPSNAQIDEFTVTYDNGTIDATIDAQGRITVMQHHLTATDATGSGSMVVPVTLRMHGDHTATYTITY